MSACSGLQRRGPRAAVLGLTMTVVLCGGAVNQASASVTPSLTRSAEASEQRPTDVCNHTTARPTIRQGSRGPAVAQAQCYLNWSVRNVNLREDGIRGPRTRDATIRFQRCARIRVDGIIGPQTWGALASWANSPRWC
jgi:peptidoglycan hydrolase-like protein with peptidoglycan-binding domain